MEQIRTSIEQNNNPIDEKPNVELSYPSRTLKSSDDLRKISARLNKKDVDLHTSVAPNLSARKTANEIMAQAMPEKSRKSRISQPTRQTSLILLCFSLCRVQRSKKSSTLMRYSRSRFERFFSHGPR